MPLFTHEGRKPKTFLCLIQLDDWQAVDAENGGDFAAVMDVMFEDVPDDPLERNRRPHFSRKSRPFYPHPGVWLECRLDLLCVTQTFRLTQRREDAVDRCSNLRRRGGVKADVLS